MTAPEITADDMLLFCIAERERAEIMQRAMGSGAPAEHHARRAAMFSKLERTIVWLQQRKLEGQIERGIASIPVHDGHEAQPPPCAA